MRPVQRLRWSTLALVALVAAAAGAVLGGEFFGSLPRLGWGWVTLVLVALFDVVLALRIRSAIARGRVGQDRSQIHPVTIARSLALGQASAVLGALAGGVGAGFSVFLAYRMGDLAAARDELPAAIAVAVSGALLAGCGLWLEASCSTPPEDPEAEVDALAQPS